MATVTTSAPAPRPPHRFTVQQYERLTETGVLTGEDRVELLEGLIVDKVTRDPPHNAAIDLTRGALEGVLLPGWIIREQMAVRLIDSEPEPDLAVVRGPVKRYVTRHPTPEDIAHALEVSDSTLADDRSRKGRVYARARIPVYWIINLVERQIEVYTQPRGGRVPGYRQRRDYGLDEEVPVIIAGRQVGTVAVRDLLP